MGGKIFLDIKFFLIQKCSRDKIRGIKISTTCCVKRHWVKRLLS